MPIHPLLKHNSGISGQRLCVLEEEADLTPHDAPIFKCPAAPGVVPVAGGGGIEPHGQGTPGSPWWAGPWGL